MSGGAPKGPRMATLQSRNKKREHKDPEFKQKRHNSFQSFFATKKPAATTMPKFLTPSLGLASLPAPADEIMEGRDRMFII